MMQTVPRETFRLPLNMHKLVEMRRRTRIDRSRQIANNAELQRNMLDTTRMYNNETERRRAHNELQTTMGPSLTRVHQQVRAGVIGPPPRIPAAEQAAREAAEDNDLAARVNAAEHVRDLTARNQGMRDRRSADANPKAKPKAKPKARTRTLTLQRGQSTLPEYV